MKHNVYILYWSKRLYQIRRTMQSAKGRELEQLKQDEHDIKYFLSS